VEGFILLLVHILPSQKKYLRQTAEIIEKLHRFQYKIKAYLIFSIWKIRSNL